MLLGNKSSNKLKIGAISFFHHLFPFGWFYSVFGMLIFSWSIFLLKPIIKGNIKIAQGHIFRISEPLDQTHGDGGGQCGLLVYIKLSDERLIECGESCEYFEDPSIGKIATIKFDGSDKYGNSSHNKILMIESKKINNYLGMSELATLLLFLWGSYFLYIAYRDIKNEYKTQLDKEEKRKNQPPSTINYDKFN